VFQSVMAQRQGTGSSGVGFAFALATIKEVLPDKNICLAEDKQSGTQYQVGLDKRGILAWPQSGDTWILDRSLGHWALRAKVTDTAAPVITGSAASMTTAHLQLVTLLEGLGLLQDGTTPGSIPVISVSKNTLSPTLQQLIAVMDAQGLVDDQTTAATVPVDVWQNPTLTSPFQQFGGTYQTVRYKINTNGDVRIEGLVKTPSAISGSNTIFTLLPGFVPLKRRVFGSQANVTACFELEVLNSGVVQLSGIPASTTIAYASVECSFSTL
jgi:hypothetical protein